VVFAGDSFGEEREGAGFRLLEISLSEAEGPCEGCRQLRDRQTEGPGRDVPRVDQTGISRDVERVSTEQSCSGCRSSKPVHRVDSLSTQAPSSAPAAGPSISPCRRGPALGAYNLHNGRPNAI